MGEKVSQYELARRLECSTRTIKIARKNGRISGTKNPKNGWWEFDVDECRKQLHATSTAYKNPEARDLGAENDKGPKKHNRAASSDDEDNENDDNESGPIGPVKTIAEARLQRETYLALQAKLDYEKDSGLYISVEDVKREFEDIAVKVQMGVLSVPPRVSAIIAAETDEFKVQSLLMSELKLALRTIADGLKLTSP